MSENIQHPFVGHSILCQVCKLSRKNAIHGDEIHIIACSHDDNCTDPAVYTCGTCSRSLCERHKSLHMNGHAEVTHKSLRKEEPKEIEKCPAHICINCGAKWEHIYACGKKADYENKCRSCASQATAEINRKDHIDEIKLLGSKVDPIINAREQNEIATEHYGSVKLMIQDSNGQLLSNWQEIISQHILGLEKIMLKIRIHSESSRKLRTDLECEEMTKLTQEERNAFLADAKRMKERKTPTVSETEKKEKAIDKGYKATLKAIADSLKAKGLSGDLLKSKLALKAELADIPQNIVKEFEI